MSVSARLLDPSHVARHDDLGIETNGIGVRRHKATNVDVCWQLAEILFLDVAQMRPGHLRDTGDIIDFVATEKTRPAKSHAIEFADVVVVERVVFLDGVVVELVRMRIGRGCRRDQVRFE